MRQRRKKIIASIGFLGIVFSFFCPANGQDLPSYKDVKLPVEKRVELLVNRLTLDQKIKLLQYRGTPVETNGLDIPAYNWWNECLHGVARAGKATVFPQAIGLAATWDTSLIKNVGDAISDEARAKYAYFSSRNKRDIYQGLNFWTPNINIFRDPRWGRGMETYGEDPFLTGKIASSFIRGLQGNDPKYYKTIATVKHFAVHSGPEQSRHKFNAQVSDRDFYETYTPAFKMAVQEAGVYSLMCAYNRFRDKPCCGNSFLLTDLLRRQWGFKGFIVTDCGAVDDFFTKGAHEVVPNAAEAAAMAIKAGVDLECGDVFNALDKAVAQKLVTEEDLNVAIRRLFTARFKLGLFDQAGDVPYNAIPYSVVENRQHQDLAFQAARKSIVLLKNEGVTLPIRKTVKTIAVIGPNADDEEVMLANYNGYPTHIVTPLEGIRSKLPNAKVLYAKGSPHADGLPSVEVIPSSYLYRDASAKDPGLNALYYKNTEQQGAPGFSRVDTSINFTWIDHPPGEKFDAADFSVTWTGYLKSPVTGTVTLDIYGSNKFELILDQKSLFSFASEHHAEHKYAKVSLQKGQMYALKIRFTSSGPSAQIKLNWELPGADLKKQALEIASKSDMIVMCMGLSPRVEGEEMKIKMPGFDGGDRTQLRLPAVQEDLIRAVSAIGKPMVLVLLNGSAVAVNWEDQHIPAILETWYGGQKGGAAIADVLFGDYNPSGRLPVTFYKTEKDLPPFDDYNMKGRTYRYFEGKPLYPFGYGLSYTNFSYTNFKLPASTLVRKALKVSVVVQNVGKLDGEEVVQLYVKNNTKLLAAPIRSLKGFKRIPLKKGERKTVEFTLNGEDFKAIDNQGRSVINPGLYSISVGGGQYGQSPLFKIPAVSKSIRLLGKPIVLD